MDFINQNILLIAVVVTSGLGLLWPMLMRSGANEVSPAEATLLINREDAHIVDVREADEFITAGVVSVNGEIVTELGTKVKRSDEVKFHDQPVNIERKVYVLPAVPENVLVAEDGVVTVPPVPLIIDQVPVPTDGAFPAKVTEVEPQVVAPV